MYVSSLFLFENVCQFTVIIWKCMSVHCVFIWKCMSVHCIYLKMYVSSLYLFENVCQLTWVHSWRRLSVSWQTGTRSATLVWTFIWNGPSFFDQKKLFSVQLYLLNQKWININFYKLAKKSRNSWSELIAEAGVTTVISRIEKCIYSKQEQLGDVNVGLIICTSPRGVPAYSP